MRYTSKPVRVGVEYIDGKITGSIYVRAPSTGRVHFE
jgi:hypothetical protein